MKQITTKGILLGLALFLLAAASTALIYKLRSDQNAPAIPATEHP